MYREKEYNSNEFFCGIVIVKFGRHIALSIVACGMLCEATSYTNWDPSGGTFQGGDIVNISYNFQTLSAILLTQNINLTSGTLTANINAQAINTNVITNGALVGNFGTGSINFGSSGSEIIFNISKGQDALGVTDAFKFNGTTFTANANLNINATMAGGGNILNATNGSLDFKGELTISGNSTNAIITNGTILNINQSGGKDVNISGNLSLTNGTNNIKLDTGDNITGAITVTNGTTKLNLSSGGSINGAFTGTGTSNLTLNIEGANSTYAGDVINNGTSNVTINNNGRLDGNLNASGNSLTLTMGSGTITDSVISTANTNKLQASGGGNTIESLSFTGDNSWNSTWGQDITITGNAAFTATNGGKNKLAITGGGEINGTLTTSGITTLNTDNSTSIGTGIRHSNGDFTANFNGNSTVSGGIETTGNGTGTTNFNGTSDLIGTSSFASNTNTLTLNDTSTIRGNTSFSNNSTLTAKNGTTIIGQVITAGGTANYTFGEGTNSTTAGATVTGGIDTNHGATKTTATFNDNSTLQNGTSNFHADIGITFDNISKAIDETFNIFTGSTVDITFKTNAEMQGGSITNNGGTTNIKFQDNSKMQAGTSTATIKTIDGTTNLNASSNAMLTGAMVQSGGAFNGTFSNTSSFNGNANQSGGNSNIKFENNSSWNGSFEQTGGGSTSTITFDNKATMTGNIITKNGITNITFNNGTKITGNIETNGKDNKVTFDHAELHGNLDLDGLGPIDGDSVVKLTGSTVTGNIQGYDKIDMTIDGTQVNGFLHQGGSYDQQALKAEIKNSSVINDGFLGSGGSNNTLTIDSSTINKGVQQNQGTLKVNATTATITGGFSGTSGSENIVKMTNGSLKGGISQNTGTLDYEAEGTSVSGGFIGTDSQNTMLLMNTNFNNGNITQERGSLQGSVIGATNLRDFRGTNSTNNLDLNHSDIKNIDQNGGSLTFSTDSNVDGHIQGIGGSRNSISMRGSTVTGQISQNTGSMSLQTFNANTQAISMQDATFTLQANNTTSTTLTLNNSTSSGTANSFRLTGQFSQTGGTSSLIFTNSTFNTDATLNNANATLNFTGSTIQRILASSGTSSITLSDSHMQDFSGTRGTHSLILSSQSTAEAISQNMGSLAVSASSNSTIKENITASGFATLSVSLSSSTAEKNILNQTGGEMTVALVDSEIKDSVEQQSAGNLSFSATNSKVEGHYKQFEGISSVNFLNSSIKNGIDLENLTSANMNFHQNSKISNGLKMKGSNVNFDLLGSSSIEGNTGAGTQAIKQTTGNMTGNLNQTSSIKGDILLEDGVSKLYLYGKSSITGNITANRNDTAILIDDSTITGNMTINGGVFSLTAQNGSVVQGNGGAGNKSQVNITNADFTLILDTGSQFHGDITQNNNKQTIVVKQGSTLDGDITNTDVTSSISVNNATITGSITQNQGNLALDLSNGGIIGGNILLNGSETILSGSGTGNQIRGNFSQTDGNLTGSMTGLTLVGTYTQNGGNSSVKFINSTFQNNTEIKDAITSSLTFDNSTLQGYTTDGGVANALTLKNGTRMNGTLTLKNQAQTTLTMDNSTLTGANTTAITSSDTSFLTLATKDSTITGKIEFDTGGLKGSTDNTNIAGDVELKNTVSDVLFGNASTITGNLTATGATSNNTVKFDNSSITGDVSQDGGTINFDLSNGSSVGQNLAFTDTKAHFTGSGAGNVINGKFDSIGTILTGDVSGLNLKGTFTQNNGSSNIVFKNNSLFESKMTLTGGSSDISFLKGSGIQNEIEISNQTGASISLNDQSFIQGNIAVSGTNPTALNAQNNSTITGNINLNNSTTNISLRNQSSYQGVLTQEGDSLTINADNSTLTSDMNLRNGNTNISLSNGSNLTGTITADNNPLTVSLTTNSSFNTTENPQAVTVTNADFSLAASGGSIFGGNLTHTSNNGAGNNANLTLGSGSTYSGTMEFDNITVSAKFNQSQILSDSVKINGKTALLEFDGAGAGGEIQGLTANDTDLTINTKNQSHITINNLQANTTGNLNLSAHNNSRLSASVTLNGNITATYTADTNGNLNVDTKIADQRSTLTVDINGGILQGSITQDPDANNTFSIGEVALQNAGRWAVTGDTQTKNLTLTNTHEALFSDAIFASVFNSPLSYVDFTLELEDMDTSSRIGKEIVAKPQPVNGQIPDPGNGRTYARTLQLNELKGDNGLFRVYADLGTKLADSIHAEKASGNHIIQVQYRAATFREIGSDRIVVAKVKDAGSSVSFKGTQSEIGLTKYDTEIIKENAADGGFEWIIGQATPAGMSYSSKIIASILQSQYRTFMVEVDSLDRRLGDLEFIKRDKGFWIRSYIGSNTKEATDFSTTATDDYYSVWSGFDYNSLGLTVHNFVGIFFNYTGINTESKDYTGKSSNISFGFYNTFKANSGFYADILAKYIYTISEFEISNYSLAKNSPKFDNHKFLLNAEIGYSFYYGEKRKSGYIQPQLQVTSGYIHKTDLSVVDVSGETINATIGRNFPVSVRAGAFWGQVFGEKIKSHIKLGTSFVYDVDSGGDLFFKDSSAELSFKQGSDFRWVLSAQTDFTFSEFFKLYASFDTSFFGNYNTTYSANLGIRFNFGRPNNYVANVPVVYNPYEPPVVINDDKRTVPVVKRYTTKDIDQNYVGKPRRVESYIQGNTNPHVQQGSPTYVPTRQPHRDLTDVVEFEGQ